jgi:hypothetical protein
MGAIKMSNRKVEHIANGGKFGEQLRINCLFDPDTFEELKQRAYKEKTSMAEQIRLMVEWGLESAKEENY